jgi:kinesin family protein 6/9
MASGSTKQKRKVLSLEEKVQAIILLDAGKPVYKVAEDFGVGKTQIQSLRKRIAKVLNDFENNVNGSTKCRRHVTGNEEINELCLEWFKDAVNRRINVAEPLLKEKALVYANVLGNTNFKVMIQITMY